MAKTFNSLLVQVPRSMEPFGYKSAQSASIESPDGQQMEQDFARLAYMFLQDRAAPLMRYLLGFEVVNREEDGSRAVGIFGFKIGKEYYYVPAFFMNNQIKGVDSILSKRTNTFMPLQEDWINFIINRQTIELGSGADGDKIQKDFENPNFDFLSQPPVGPMGKISEAQTPWSLKEAWRQMHDQLADALEKDAEFQRDWTGLVCAVARQDLPLEKTAEGSALTRWLAEKGGPKAVSSFLGALTSNPKYANAALSFYPSVESLYVHEFAAGLMPKTAAKVTVVTEVNDYSDGETKKRIVRDGFAIKDDRPEAAKSEAYDIDYERHFSNPSTSGTYQVLLKSGRTTKCWVFMPSGSAKNDVVVIVEQDKLMHRLAEPGAVYVRDSETGDCSDAYKKAVSIDAMELGRNYVLIDDKGHATSPVEITSVIAEDGKRTKLRVNWRGCYDVVRRPTYGRDFEGRYGSNPGCGILGGETGCSSDYIELADHNGSITKSGNDTLVLPANWKALRIYDPSDDDDGIESYDARRVLQDAFQLGTLVDVNEAMIKSSFHKLTVASDDGMEYYFRFDDNYATRPVSYKKAYVTLVTRFGLPVGTSEELLKEAQSKYKARRLIKMAQMPSQLVGVDMPQPGDQSAMTDPYSGLPMYNMPYEQDMGGSMTGMPQPPQPDQYGINIGGEAEMDAGAQNLAVQAAQAGQKNIFDHASIGGLAKVYDTGAVIDSYVPELMKALDRLGRILFLYYWKNEDFAERYGTNDIAEMEDLIRSVFKSFGELVLKLRKKSIDKDDANTIEM